MSTITVATTAEALHDFLSDEANMPRLAPWWIGLRIVRSEPVAGGLEVDYRMRAYGVPFSWKTRVDVIERPHRIRYHQEKGPYARWEHLQTLTPTNGGVELESRIQYGLRGPAVVRWLLGPVARLHIRHILAHRAAVLAKTLSPTTAASR